MEVEAYLGPEDLASHARAGRTARTAPMWGPPGFAYVYLVYGMYDCLNVVSGPEGAAGAVLIRAIEPLEGAAAMRAALADLRASRRRARAVAGDEIAAAGRPPPDHRVAAGPGLVAGAFSIDRSATGTDLCDPRGGLRLERAPAGSRPVDAAVTPRVGIDYAGERWADEPLRFVDASSPSLSRPLPRQR